MTELLSLRSHASECTSRVSLNLQKRVRWLAQSAITARPRREQPSKDRGNQHQTSHDGRARDLFCAFMMLTTTHALHDVTMLHVPCSSVFSCTLTAPYWNVGAACV